MTAKRMTKAELIDSLGAFKPVGHVVLAFADDDAADQARQALSEAGCGDEDVLVFGSGELRAGLEQQLRAASGGSGFGYEVTLMRRYLDLAEQGAGWLVVYAPEDAAVERVRAVAQRHAARSAVRYGRLASEELVDAASKREQL